MAKYPCRFVKLVKAAYPKNVGLGRALAENSPLVGRYLDDGRHLILEPVPVVVAFHRGEQEMVKAAAKELILRRALYRWWLRIMDEAGYATGQLRPWA